MLVMEAGNMRKTTKTRNGDLTTFSCILTWFRPRRKNQEFLMTGMTGMTGMSGMTGMTRMTGMTGMTKIMRITEMTWNMGCWQWGHL
jgi:hypothetical protein